MDETTQSVLSSTLGASFKKQTGHDEMRPKENAQGGNGDRDRVVWGRAEVTGGTGSGKKNI